MPNVYLKMDLTTHFFSKLKKLAVTLESETSNLQLAFENRNSDDDSGERPADKRAMQAILFIKTRTRKSHNPHMSILIVSCFRKDSQGDASVSWIELRRREPKGKNHRSRLFLMASKGCDVYKKHRDNATY